MSDAKEPGEPQPVEPDPVIDLDAVIREVEADARALRRSGAYPPDFERELADLFARFAPPAASGDLRALIDAAEEHGLIEPFIPVESQKPAGRFVKQGFAKALGWYHTWLTQEISQFAGASIRALRVSADRLEALQGRLGDVDEQAGAVAGLRWLPERAVSAASIAAALAVDSTALAGRVLVARAAQGELVAALCEVGVDAYGIEIDAADRDRAEAKAIDLLADDAAPHLRSVSPRALGGVVLRGPDIDAAAVGSRLLLVRLAVSRIADGGSIVIVATEPRWWREHDPVAADLAFAPPWSAATCEFVLDSLGAVDVRVTEVGHVLIARGTVRHPDGDRATAGPARPDTG